MSESVQSPPGPVRYRRAVRAALAVLVAAVVAIAGLVAGARLVPAVGLPPSEESVDAGFARDMRSHHTQAVEMSVLVLDRTQDPEVRALARDILLTQQQQAGQMYGWLEQWELPQASSRPPMVWAGGTAMTHGGMSDDAMSGMAVMPGIASPEDLARLREATGSDAERIYLELMIPHHEGGVEMARTAAERAEEPEVQRLARTIVDSQTAELAVLKEMLAARGGPLPAP